MKIMLLDMWNYMRGIVVIEVTGFSVERFVNLAVHRGIYVWDVKYSGATVLMKVSAKGFKALKECGKKTGCRFRIVEKLGYPFVVHKYRKRKLFAAGIVLFVFLLYYLSGFVWLIEISGNNRLEDSVLNNYLKAQGLYIGARSSNINRNEMERNTAQHFGDISFINIGIEGTKATVTIAETLPKEEIIDNSLPCDIVAKKDGIITNIYVSSGDPLVKEKDIVSKGDILVRGAIVAGSETEPVITGYVHSKAEVRARQYYEMNFTVDNMYTRKDYTGNIKTRYSINFINKELFLINSFNLYNNYDKITEKQQIKFGEDYPLPIIISKYTFKEYIPVDTLRSAGEMKELAMITVNNRIIREFDFSADVVEKQIEYSGTSDGLSIRAIIITNEDIGEIRYIEQTETEEQITSKP